jgi:CDP-glucose 4,6-dehydratase
MTLAEALRNRPELKGEAFNFSNELQITALDLVQRILAVMESPLQPVILNQAVNEIRHQYLSAEKARRMLQWKPLYDLDSALVQTVSWYRDYLTA